MLNSGTDSKEGGEWDWLERSYEDAVEVQSYRDRGYGRNNAVRAQRWIETGKGPVRLIREPLIKEFDRARRLLLRYVSSTHGFDPPPSEWSILKYGC
jgi:hypothetical protein